MRIACAFARSVIEIRHAGLADRHEVLERLFDAGIDRRRLIAGQKLVAQALGATHAVETALRRINAGRLSDLLDNYDEIAERFRGTPFAGYLD